MMQHLSCCSRPLVARPQVVAPTLPTAAELAKRASREARTSRLRRLPASPSYTLASVFQHTRPTSQPRRVPDAPTQPLTDHARDGLATGGLWTRDGRPEPTITVMHP